MTCRANIWTKSSPESSSLAKIPGAFLVASIVGDLKDAPFTLILIALSQPIYLLLALRKELQPIAAHAVVVPPE
jgi:hypothetical protein